MLFDGERTGIQRPFHSKCIELPSRHCLGPQTTHRIDQQLHDDGGERDGRTPNAIWANNFLLEGCIGIKAHLMLRNMLSPLPRVVKNMPSTQARTVFATSPPSVLRTAARTDSYWDSWARVFSNSAAFSWSPVLTASLMASIFSCGKFGSHWWESWTLCNSWIVSLTDLSLMFGMSSWDGSRPSVTGRCEAILQQ